MNASTPTLEPTPDQPNRRFRRATAIGLTAGLLGGGAVGLLVAVPSLTSAASDTVTLQDSGDTGSDTNTVTITDDATDTARPDAGARIREHLQSLVDDGTITAEQADAIAAHLAEGMPGRGGHGGGMGGLGHGGRGFDGTVVADALGITVDELAAAVQSGQSIADVATAEGVDVQVVIDALVTEAEARIAQGVTDGRFTQEEADAKLADLTARITERVNQAGGFGRGGHGRGHMGGDASATTETSDSSADS
jgi:hypothetical protein